MAQEKKATRKSWSWSCLYKKIDHQILHQGKSFECNFGPGAVNLNKPIFKSQIPRGLLGRGGGGGERNLMLQIDRCINNTLATTEYLSILLISTEDIENS